MIKVFCSENRLRIQQVKDLLDGYGIPCFIKNEYSIGGVGEISPFDAWPEVWLTDNEWFNRATQLIAEFEAAEKEGSPWVCRQCQEHNEASFEICWQCGTEFNP